MSCEGEKRLKPGRTRVSAIPLAGDSMSPSSAIANVKADARDLNRMDFMARPPSYARPARLLAAGRGAECRESLLLPGITVAIYREVHLKGGRCSPGKSTRRGELLLEG